MSIDSTKIHIFSSPHFDDDKKIWNNSMDDIEINDKNSDFEIDLWCENHNEYHRVYLKVIKIEKGDF